MAIPSDSVFARFFFDQDALPARGKFFSRVLGIFSEELVRIWAADERAPYKDLGRPRLFDPETDKGYSLDFTFEDRITRKRFAVEMKCEIEYQNYRFLTLREPAQLDHHKKDAFHLFRQVAKNPESIRVELQRQRTPIDGAILVWGDVTSEGKQAVIDHYNFNDVIGLNKVLEDLWDWRPKEFEELVGALGDWSFELFNFLGGGAKSRMQIFKNNDAGFIGWRENHPEGYICNVPNPRARNEREFYLRSICIHRTPCSVVGKNKNGEQPWTTGQYFKLCANDVEAIEDWVDKHVDAPANWKPKRCSKCSP